MSPLIKKELHARTRKTTFSARKGALLVASVIALSALGVVTTAAKPASSNAASGKVVGVTNITIDASASALPLDQKLDMDEAQVPTFMTQPKKKVAVDTGGLLKTKKVVTTTPSGDKVVKEVVKKEREIGWTKAVASWYGDGFIGNHTASGKTLTSDCMYVAHKKLAFGTKVEFMYNGKTVVGVIEDRGPFIAGRDFDFGPGVAAALNFDGVQTISYRILP